MRMDLYTLDDVSAGINYKLIFFNIYFNRVTCARLLPVLGPVDLKYNIYKYRSFHEYVCTEHLHNYMCVPTISPTYMRSMSWVEITECFVHATICDHTVSFIKTRLTLAVCSDLYLAVV